MKRTTMLLVGALAAQLSGCALANRMSGMDVVHDLEARGIAAEAKILDIWDTRVRVNDDPVVGFLLEVHPPDGKPYEARTKGPISIVHIPRFQPGAVVPIRFDPQNPAASCDGARFAIPEAKPFRVRLRTRAAIAKRPATDIPQRARQSYRRARRSIPAPKAFGSVVALAGSRRFPSIKDPAITSRNVRPLSPPAPARFPEPRPEIATAARALPSSRDAAP
jgi:hypothetical protein